MFLFPELIKSPFIHRLASYSSANHLTVHQSISLTSYFYAIHLLGELFSCRPFNFPSVHPFGELFHSLGELFSYRPFNSRSFGEIFWADHITLHPSIPLASYFCTVQPLGELFSCLLFDSPSFGELFWCRPFNSPVFGETFSCRPYNSPPIHPFGELFLCRPSLGRVIFVPTI